MNTLGKISTVTFLLLCSLQPFAQPGGSTSLGVAAGLGGLIDSDNMGMLLYLEPRHRFSEKTVIGLRVGITINTHHINNRDVFQFDIYDPGDNGVVSVVPTFDRYFLVKGRRGYLGAGAGAYLLVSYLEATRLFPTNPAESALKINVDNQLGLLLRGGLESGRMQFGVEYNYVPKFSIALSGGQAIGTVDKSYFGATVGVIIGGGEHREAAKAP